MESQNPAPTKLIVVAHAPLASALLAVLAHVHGSVPDHVLAVDVAADEAPSITQATIARLIKGGGALILTDLPGATPHNCANVACDSFKQARVISPVSAPLLLRAVNYSHLPVQALFDRLSQG
jgi:PTS system ascorbate-specific IIA component